MTAVFKTKACKHIGALILMSVSAVCLAACGGSSATPAPVAQSDTMPTTLPTPTTEAKERYLDLMFDNVSITQSVLFGSNTHLKTTQDLYLDIYSPEADDATDRPVIILAFAGGFETGSRDAANLVNMATDYAKRGYVVASIDYRLYETEPQDQGDLEVVMIRAMHDMKAAVRFFREDALGADIYGTREDIIIVGGISAGAIIASTTGTLDAADGVSAKARNYLQANGGFAGNSSDNAANISSGVQGIISISGAISDFLWIDQYSAPIVAAHEEFDQTVPCNYDMGSDGFFLAGGCEMAERIGSYGQLNALYLVEGSQQHVGYTDEDWEKIQAGTAEFVSKLF